MDLRLFLFFLLAIEVCNLSAQPKRQDIFSDYVFFDKRQRLEKDIRENTIAGTFQSQLTTDNEHRFESACLAVSQFLIQNDHVAEGFQKMFSFYDSLSFDTKRALLEAVHAVYPSSYGNEVEQVLKKEKDPLLFSMCGAYLYRANKSISRSNLVKLQMIETFPSYDSLDILVALEEFLNDKYTPASALPRLRDLFEHHKKLGSKVIYSFQRWNRDQPGLAIVQLANGSFARHPDGRLMVFEQLARAASNLPFFITNGNTPQGIFSIIGTGVSRNKFIGPTPNIQLVMPFEDSTQPFVHGITETIPDPREAYLKLLPDSWKNYLPVWESYKAGKIGRTAIIAHGTTIDPEYFRETPFYPLTPTMGCLCTKELWNVTSGKLLVSEQYNLFSAFMSTPGSKGYLFVINLDDQAKRVTREEIEKIIGK
jgi:hypothetical protein